MADDFLVFADLIRDFSFIRVRRMDFEREELSDSDGEREPQRVAVRCELAQDYLRQFRDDNTTLGDGLMSLLEGAETVSKERACEGYYLATAHHVKKLYETRMSMDGALNNLVAHHQRCHQYCQSRQIQDILRENSVLKRTVETTTSDLRTVRGQLEDSRSRNERLSECLEAQFKCRYETKIRVLEDELARVLTDRDDIKASRQQLRQEVADLKKQMRNNRSVVAFLNKRLRAVIKSIRAGAKVGTGPKCHILGTYDDILGVPV